MNLYDSKDFFFIRSNGVVGPGTQTLVIQKSTHCISIQTDDRLLNTVKRGVRNEGQISGIIGIVDCGVSYLAVISCHLQVGTINKAKINKVVSVKFLPFTVSLICSHKCSGMSTVWRKINSRASPLRI